MDMCIKARLDEHGEKDGDAIGTGSGIETVATSTTATATNTITKLEGDEVLPGLPRLNYNLRYYKTKLSLIILLLVIELSLLPIALFYGLWFYTTLRHGIIFTIITSFLRHRHGYRVRPALA